MGSTLTPRRVFAKVRCPASKVQRMPWEPTPQGMPIYCALDSQRDINSAISLLFFSSIIM
jgi:hypothetical protein